MKIKLGLLMMIFISGVNVAKVQDGSSDVIHMSAAKLAANYWLDKLSGDEPVLMTQQQISQHNQKLVSSNRFVNDPLSLPDLLSAKALRAKLNSISKPVRSARFYLDGHKLDDQDYQAYQHNMHVEAIEQSNPIEFGLVVKRAALRTFPTLDRVFNSGQDPDLDRFQESALFPGDVVAVLHSSRDGKWLLVQGYNYIAWMEASNVAIGSKQQIQTFSQAAPFLVITGSKVYTNVVPTHAQLSEIQLDMGVRLPLVAEAQIPNQLHGQNPYASHVVWLPTRDSAGKLVLQQGLIARNQDVHQGYLAFTSANVINQAFKFLGERYGWGHDFNGRDCTGFIGEIYRSFGILMPRNSGDQGNSQYGIDRRFGKNATMRDKLTALEQLQIGDLIYIPGHVMLYLGDDEGQPYVIHDVKGLAYFNQSGQLYKGSLNGVSVTPLLPLRLSQNNSYLDRMYNLKRLR